MPTTKQKKRAHLLYEQDRFEDRRLAAAFVEMVGALPARPQPRHCWDNVASPGRANHKGRGAVLCGRIAMNAAIKTGARSVIEATAQRIARYFDAMKDAVLAPYYALTHGAITLDDARAKASKETTEALDAIMQSVIRHDDRSPRTLQEIDEAIQALCDLRATMAGRGAVPGPINGRVAAALS